MRERIIEEVQLIVIIGQLQDSVVNFGGFYNVLLLLLFIHFLFNDLTSFVLEFVKVLESALQRGALVGRC